MLKDQFTKIHSVFFNIATGQSKDSVFMTTNAEVPHLLTVEAKEKSTAASQREGPGLRVGVGGTNPRVCMASLRHTPASSGV